MEASIQKEIERYKTQEEIDLIDLFKILLKNKTLIIAVTIIVFIISSIGAIITKNTSKTARAVISYSYDGISNGKNPDGSLFSTNQIVDSVVLNRLYYKYPILKTEGIERKDLVMSLKVNGITPDKVSKLAEASIKQGKDFIYTPSNYSLELKLTGDNELDKKILNTLIGEYVDYFTFKYSHNTVFSKIDLNVLAKYDYREKIEIIQSNILQIKSRSQEMSGKGFVSKQTGYSYEDVIRFLGTLEHVDLKNAESIITIENITKNPSERKLIIEDQIRKLEIEREKLKGSSQVLSKMLKDYRPDSRKVILPNMGEKGIQLSTEEEYYTSLLDKYRVTNTRIMEIGVDLNELKRTLDEITEIPEDTLNGVREVIESTVEKANSIIDNVNIMNSEYNNKYYSDQVKIISPVETIGSSKTSLILALGLVMGVILGIMAAFIKEFILHIKSSIKE